MKDEEIIELLYTHNDEGLKETKAKYEKLLNSLSYRIVKNSADAMECVNDTYMKVWETIPPYRPNYLKSFLMKIIRQISIDKYRYNHRQTRYEENEVYLSELDYDIKDERNLDDEVLKRLLTTEIEKFLDTLDKQTRVLFMRKYYLFEDTKSLSKRFGLSENNINVKMLRARNKLKAHLESEGYIFEKD